MHRRTFLKAAGTTAAVTVLPVGRATAAAVASSSPQALIAEALDRYDVVAYSEFHSYQTQLELLTTIVLDPAVVRRSPVIAVEFGNARYQHEMDRYIGGEDVPVAQVRPAWHDTINPFAWDAQVYEDFFTAIRDHNRRQPANRRLRVLLTDVRIDWSAVRDRSQVEELGVQRDIHMADRIESEALRAGRKVFFIAGTFHVARVRPEAPPPEWTAVRRLEQHHARRVCVVLEHNGQPELQARLTGWSSPQGVWLEAHELADSRDYLPLPPPLVSPRLGELADAFVYNGPLGDGYTANPWPSQYSDTRWAEMRRRWELSFGEWDEHHAVHTTARWPVGVFGAAPFVRGNPPGGSAISGVEAATRLRDLLREHPVVALTEPPQLGTFHAFVRHLLDSAGDELRTLVVPFGNARHQDLVDSYVDDGEVPDDRLRAVWQDSTRPLLRDSGLYRRFFEHVRAVNAGRPAGQRLRVVLCDPSLDWQTATPASYRATVAGAARWTADLFERTGVAERGGCLWLVDPWELTARDGNAVEQLRRRLGGRLRRVLTHTGFGSWQVGDRRLESEMERGQLGALAGTWVGRLSARQVYGASAGHGATLATVADDLLYLAKPTSLQLVSPSPSVYRDAYWAQARRRYRIAHGHDPVLRQVFPIGVCQQAVDAPHDHEGTGRAANSS